MRENVKVIDDFPGLVTNIDPQDLPPGASQVLVNLQASMPGRLQSRKAIKPLSFEKQTTVPTGPLKG